MDHRDRVSVELEMTSRPPFCFSSRPRKAAKADEVGPRLRSEPDTLISYPNQSVETMALTPLVTTISDLSPT